MRLQLDSTALRSAENAPTAQPSSGGRNEDRTTQLARSGDTVGISGPSAALGRLSAERASRIQQLTAAVQNDTYRVPAGVVSKAILAQAEA
jgi:anti-sigma28 factor (negative regulator of flagellin synthesis)